MDQVELPRLQALREVNLLDTMPSESFDRITRMASQLFDAPLSAVSLTDVSRQWFKSQVGCAMSEISRIHAPCAEVTRSRQLLVVHDLSEDERFSAGILVQMGVRFYAGAPLLTKDGFCLGSMCVLDAIPRTVTDDQRKVLQDLAAMVMAQVELEHAFGRIDPISSLPNQNQFIDDLEDLARRGPAVPRVVALVDLDDTNHLNEALRVLGSSCLDDLVRASKGLISGSLDQQVSLYRVGAAQLAFVLDEGSEHDVDEAVAALHSAFKTPIVSHGIPITLNVAIGLVPFLPAEISPHDVLRMAHSAAQDARATEQPIGSYNPGNDEIHLRRFKLLTAMREALEESGQLKLVYQPRIEIRSGRMVSAEALLRWTHPELGIVPPGEFIPLVERTALIRPVTTWVIESVLDQIVAWREAGLAARISVNVSAANFEEEDFVERLAGALQVRGLALGCLELEFTESALIRNQGRVLTDLARIRKMGVHCSIDDFGTGYSSFSYLQEIPADSVKIDQSFIRRIGRGPRDRTLVAAIITMARDLGYRTVAEGVETQEIYDLLSEMGCDEVQGYLMSRPIPPTALSTWLASAGHWSEQAGQAAVNTSTPLPVKPTVASACVDQLRSRVTIDQPSDNVLVAALPATRIGWIDRNMPSSRTAPSPHLP